MNKRITSLILACICFVSCFCSASPIRELSNNDSLDKQFSKKNHFSIDENTKEKYLAAAKYFSSQTSTEENTIEKSACVTTNCVSYETGENGELFHVGWYVDGYIITVMTGPDADLQIIVTEDQEVRDFTYDIVKMNGYFIHQYTWGDVTSYDNSQILTVY